jgi:segregation and condensation protein B
MDTTSMDTPTRQGLEALLFLADEPIEIDELAEVLDVEPDVVASEVEALAQRYAEEHRGIEIRRAAGGWRMYSAAGARPVLERWALAGRSGRLTQAALETLAVIAYKQPISRQDVGEIRGVNADGAVRSLVARGLVEEVGRDDGPGQATLYGTTGLFLERIGVDRLEDLPPLTEFLPEAPAPDEPELGAIKEARRRLAAATPTATGWDPTTNTGTDPDAEEDSLPAPDARVRQRDGDIEDLTDRLDQAARSAVDRLRQAVSATDRSEAEAERAANGQDATPSEGDADTAPDTGSAGEGDDA